MLLISQTMATYDEMPFRAICQRNLRNEIREGGSGKQCAEKKERGGCGKRKER